MNRSLLKHFATGNIQKIDNFINHAEQIENEISDAVVARDYAYWQYNVIDAIPDKMIEERGVSILRNLGSANSYWNRRDNELQKVNISPTPSGSGVNASVSSGIFNEVQAYAEEHDDNAWVLPVTEEYKTIRDSADLIDTVHSNLKAHFPNIADEFKDAIDKINHAKANSIEMKIAGLEMRNFLEQFKGRLIANSTRAQKVPKSRKWEKMVEDLAKTDPNTPEFDSLLREENNYDSLHGVTSELLKGNIRMTNTKLDTLVTQFTNHIYAVLNPIDNSKIGE